MEVRIEHIILDFVTKEMVRQPHLPRIVEEVTLKLDPIEEDMAHQSTAILGGMAI
jgi:hypothetical protein